MEISSLSNVEKTTHVQKTQSKGVVDKIKRNDSVSIAEGMQEAQKVREWVKLLEQMPDIPPSHFQRGGESQDIIFEVSRKLAEEVGGFLSDHP